MHMCMNGRQSQVFICREHLPRIALEDPGAWISWLRRQKLQRLLRHDGSSLHVDSTSQLGQQSVAERGSAQNPNFGPDGMKFQNTGKSRSANREQDSTEKEHSKPTPRRHSKQTLKKGAARQRILHIKRLQGVLCHFSECRSLSGQG